MTQILCTFHPQAWVNNQAIDVDLEGAATWNMEIDGDAPESNTHESDQLRESKYAPEWVQRWHGPFDVIVELVTLP